MANFVLRGELQKSSLKIIGGNTVGETIFMRSLRIDTCSTLVHR